jgi:phage terminase large subunit-like protein
MRGKGRPDLAEAAGLARRYRRLDRLAWMWDRLTPAQRAVVLDPAQIVVVEGGNQSGKSLTAVVDLLVRTSGQTEWTYTDERKRTQTAAIAQLPDQALTWYSTTTYERFLEQPWKHIQRFSLRPWESIHKLPSERVQHVDWIGGGKPKRIVLGNRTEIAVKSYDQGPGEFQAAQLAWVAVDEEAPEAIWREIQARFLASPSVRVIVAATPVLGVPWLAELRERAERGEGSVSHHRLRTLENPAHNAEAVAELRIRYRERPEELDLRLEGLPYAAAGLVYPDGLWTNAHWVDPFYLDPGRWSFYRVIDHGWRVCACLWAAVDREGNLVCYREYYGEERRIGENAAEIRRLSGDERYAAEWIDPSTMGTDAETGVRVIDLWRKHLGNRITEAPDNRVQAGIEAVGEALAARGGAQGERPRLRFFRTLTRLAAERREYRWAEVRERGDVGREKPIKRGDHLLDCLRYFVAGRPQHRRAPAPALPEGTLGRLFQDDRREKVESLRD